MFFPTTDLKDAEIYLRCTATLEEDEIKGYVPAYLFDMHRLSDGAHVGHCDLRLSHNENTYYGGNIGYEVYRPFRGNRYAAKACQLLFRLALKHEMTYMYITANPENTPSRKTIERVGGVLKEIVNLPPHNEMYRAGERLKCIYYVDLKAWDEVNR